MIETETGAAAEHFTEDDWTVFARGEGDPARRARVALHLEAGCGPCEHDAAPVVRPAQRGRAGSHRRRAR